MKITKYILIVISILALNACNDFLDITPKGKAVIETAEDYNGLIETLWPSYNPSNFSYLPVEQVHYITTEVLDYKYPAISANFLWDESFDRAKYNQNDPLYNECYKRIAKFNILIECIDESEGEEALKVKAKAQARILRAYNYFFLVNTYAKAYNPATAATDRAIVLRDEFNMEDLPGQSTVQEVYDFIQADIETSLPNLTDKRENIYRPGKAFGYAFKAKVHLYKGELDEALAAAKEAMNYDAQLWNFEEYIPNMFNPMYMVPLDLPECLLHGYGSGSMTTMQHIAPEVSALFNQMDLRKTAFLTMFPAHPLAPAGTTCFYTWNSIIWNCSGMRYSEVYLIIAECYARLGNIQEAVNTINELRKYRFYSKSVVKVSASTPEEARQIVIDERRIELILTANTFFDMKRYTVIPEYRKTLTKTYEGKEYTLDPDSHLYVMPFSIEALESNPNLVQNSK